MAPGLVGSELADTPPHYIHKTMEETYFPPISRKSTISMGSETDPSDYINKRDRSSITRGSVPASLSSSPTKFPSIDRANSTSVASLPGSRAARQRTHTREMRATYCRSPSCPSHLDISRDFVRHKPDSREDPEEDFDSSDMERAKDSQGDGSSKLPSIFSKDCDTHLDLSPTRQRHGTTYSDRSHDNRTTTLSLRRSESLANAYSHPTSNRGHNGHNGQLTARDSQRQLQTTALLLPLRNDPQLNSSRKKKKKRQRNNSHTEMDSDTQQSNRYSSDGSGTARRFTCDNDALLDAIALENDYPDEDDLSTPRQIEINSPRNVKKWLNNNNRSTQKEGKVKA